MEKYGSKNLQEGKLLLVLRIYWRQLRNMEQIHFFKPDPEIFEEIEFDYETLAQRLRELAFLNKGIKITI